MAKSWRNNGLGIEKRSTFGPFLDSSALKQNGVTNGGTSPVVPNIQLPPPPPPSASFPTMEDSLLRCISIYPERMDVC
ncbi:hypothetical protein MRB53_006328 [Persea americana]|uniref:Uncharacterized protein n=1 Tax=Persea americana TaxID=3435 RepID=A0ACC2MG11_PERAE|nr:hypothetical protein MRB53_006328 [Persea americana]